MPVMRTPIKLYKILLDYQAHFDLLQANTVMLKI